MKPVGLGRYLRQSKRRLLIASYVVLLAVSHAAAPLCSPGPRAALYEEVLSVSAYADGERKPGAPVRIAYQELAPVAATDAPVVLLLHGTPVASQTFDSLAPLLRDRHRVIVPDLPGFGGSTWALPDYSIEAHADYMLQLMNALSVPEAHVVGYSQGGGVALQMADAAADRVRSLTLLSSIGVQELELLGDYHLNHALYALQYGLLWVLHQGLPHFGYLDDTWLNLPYARNFYDSDQRPLRRILKEYRGPMLILHGRTDRLVPVEAAREHHRLVPQSELELFEGGHGLVFSRAAEIAAPIAGFVRRVQAGEATHRREAAPDRVAAAQRPFDWSQVPPIRGLALVVVCVLIALATYVTEDLACVAAGLMVARGMLGYGTATLACCLGIYTGDVLLFLAGRHFGRAVVRRAPFRWLIRESDLERSSAWFERRGAAAILISRFVPGTRLGTYVSAGLLNMTFWKFSVYFLLATFIWTPLIVGAAWWLGSGILRYLETYRRFSLPLLFGLLLLVWFAVKVIAPLFTYRGRRLLLGRWRRLCRWEFWPPWALYPPLVGYILYLGIRHRGLTLFTAANPAMPAGGLVGESKSKILEGLAGAEPYVVSSRRISGNLGPEQQLAEVEAFMEARRLTYPIVLKPDAGERGKGVRVVRRREEARRYFHLTPGDILVQEFAPGREFGVFYYRFPDENVGRIFAVTDKRFPTVVGDGARTLEELMLRDERAICMARWYMAEHRKHLHEVPGKGVEIPLVEIGTHCRGAVFLDGSWVITAELEHVVDRISRAYDGFYFGRYDIRTPSVADFQRGENFKIVELNGVTSEATNIYDPKHNLFAAYRILMEQWRLAFEIGAVNRQRGVEPTPVGRLLAMLRAHYRGSPPRGQPPPGPACPPIEKTVPSRPA